MVRNSFIAVVVALFFTSLYFLHDTLGHLAQEKTGEFKLPFAKEPISSGGLGGGVLIEFKVSNLNGNPDESGTFVIQTKPAWSTEGAQRFVELTNAHFWDECRFFRVLKNFMAQFGIHGDPETNKKWKHMIKDEPVMESNRRGVVSYAMAGPGTRDHQLFINTKHNKFLDGQGFSPIGEVVEGMDVVDKLYNGYGEGAPSGHGPSQGQITNQGNKYLKAQFPKLSYIVSARVK